MSTSVTVTLSDAVYRQAKNFADVANRNIGDVLSQAIELSLLPSNLQPSTVKPIAALSDKEILKLTRLEMSPSQDRRLSRLLNDQQKGHLTTQGRVELLTLMQIYGNGLMRKAQALREAVRRGLLEPLTA